MNTPRYLWILEWSRTNHGKREFVGAYRALHTARYMVRDRKPFYGGWHHITKFVRAALAPRETEGK